MPEQSGKADSAAAAADDGDSPTVNQGHGQSDFEDEEVEEMGEEEGGLDGEEEDDEAVEEEDVIDGEYEEVEEEEEEEDEVGDFEGEEAGEVEEDVEDCEQEEADEEDEIEGGDNEEQEFKEAEEEEDGGNSGEEEMEEQEEEEIEEKEEGDGKGEEEAGVGSVEDAATMQEDAEAAITVHDPSEAVATVQEDAKDLCEMVKSGRHDQNQNSLSSTAGDCNAGKHHEHDTSKMFSTCCKGFSSTSMGNESSAMAVKPIPSKENGFQNTSLGGILNGIQLGKQISNEASKSVKNNYLEIHGGNPSLATDNASSLLLQKDDLAVESSVRSESEKVKNDVSVTGESHLHGITDSKKLDDSNLTCVHTPQRRPRSTSPGVEPDTMNKRPAVTCVFFSRGWCIKGKACKFLHQKDGVTTTEKQNKEDKAEHGSISGSQGVAEEIVEGSKVSSTVLEDSNAVSSSEGNSLLQRALVRTYGTGSHETSQLHGHYNIQAKGEFQLPDHFQAARALVQEDYGRNFGKISRIDSVERQLSDAAFSSRRNVAEMKLVNEIPTEGSPYETAFSRSTHLVDAFAPEYKYFGSSSKVSSLLQNSLSSFGRTEDTAIRSAHSLFSNQESYNSHSLSGSQYSGLSRSFQFSQSDNKFSRAETSPNRSSNPSIEYLDGHANKDYLTSRSASFSRGSSPCRSRPDLQYMTHSVDLVSRQKTKFQCNDWEPSQPFRPSLSIGNSSVTSPGSQYDPILDSIEPANASTRDYCFQTSQRTSFQNASYRPTNIDTILNGTGTAISPAWEGLAKKVSLNDSSAHTDVDVLFGSSKLERGDSSIPRNEKAWNPDNLLERSNIKDAEFGGDWRNRVDKSRNNKESKALKFFHAALVDFMKELVKPWWRDGQLSKDAHKAVIKKSVEKVLSALQSHQVPSTPEAISQYLATSRSKLVKLVEGYVQKYANA